MLLKSGFAVQGHTHTFSYTHTYTQCIRKVFPMLYSFPHFIILWHPVSTYYSTCFYLIILQMLLKLDWSPPVVNSVVWTCIYFCIYLLFYPKRLTNEDIIEAIKTNKRATTCKCYYKPWLARSTCRKVFFFFFFLRVYKI